MTKNFPMVTDRKPDKIAVWALTRKGCRLAEKCAGKLPEAVLFVPASRTGELTVSSVELFEGFPECLNRVFHDFKGHIFIMATGIVVRCLAGLLRDKSTDPAVVVMDELGKNVISLISGHLGGANLLADRVSLLLGAEPVITTATDLAGILAFDTLVTKIGAHVENQDKIKLTSSCQLHSIPVALVAEPDLISRYYRDCKEIVPYEKPDNKELRDFEAVCIISEKTFPELDQDIVRKTLFIRPSVLSVGIGCNRCTGADEIEQAVRSVFEKFELSLLSVSKITSADKKSCETGLLEFAKSVGQEMIFWGADDLNSVSDGLFSPPSEQALTHLGIIGVAEPAALLCAGEEAELLVPKQKIGNVTVAVAKTRIQFKDEHEGRIFLVGIGPGHSDYITVHAHRVLKLSQVVVGYTSYIKLISHLLEGKKIISTGMTLETKRVEAAVKEAARGKIVSLVCSGDTGIYGLAGLVYETLDRLGLDIEVEISPGLTAAVSAASLVGAPLVNDYITLSLSDLLTPAEIVISRIKTAASSGMVTVIYNPASKKRTKLIEVLHKEFLRHRDPNTYVAIVNHAFRSGEQTVITHLDVFLNQEIGMNSIVIIGNEDTVIVKDRMVTRRGYERKKS